MEEKIFVFILLILIFGCAPSYQQAWRLPNAGDRYPVRIREEDLRTGPPRPFNYGYNIIDRQEGSTNYHRSVGDGTGTVRGSYGYSLPNGLYRKVEYVANKTGYYATVYSNEPGVGRGNPADVTMVVEPVPQGVVRN